MATDADTLDEVAQLIADVRAECLRMGATPSEIGKIMMDEATLGFIADGESLSGIQKQFQRYVKKRLPSFYSALRRAAGEIDFQ